MRVRLARVRLARVCEVVEDLGGSRFEAREVWVVGSLRALELA